MLFFLTMAAFATEPCAFISANDQSEDAEDMEFASDADPDTWAFGTNFHLYLTLDQEGYPTVKLVGVMVGNDTQFTSELQIMYLPVGGTEGVVLVDETGTLPTGEHEAAWEVSAEAAQLLYSLEVTAGEAVDFQILCEADVQESNFRGGGGCGCSSDYDLSPQSSLLMASFPFATLLRRRRRT